MSPFNLEDYEPVEERLAKFWKDHPMGRVTTELVHADENGYIVKASIYRGFETWVPGGPISIKPEDLRPGATGYASEVIGSNPVNRTSALENCETSAIGRALANLGYAPKGKRPSREEMSKATSSPTGTQESTVQGGRDGDAEDGSEGGGFGEGPNPSEPQRTETNVTDPHPGIDHKLGPAGNADYAKQGVKMCRIKGCDYVFWPEGVAH